MKYEPPRIVDATRKGPPLSANYSAPPVRTGTSRGGYGHLRRRKDAVVSGVSRSAEEKNETEPNE
jgi:hypothetical protein